MTRLKHGLALTNRYAARRTLRRALLVLFGMPVFFTALMLTSAEVLGQDKWMVTPSRGGAEGAKQNAQLTTINNEFSRMNACTGVGRIYAPTHPSADLSGCVSGAGGIPGGAVMAFNLTSCPTGWSPVTAAQGRFIVGTGTLGADGYGLGETGGSARHALTEEEMPPHTHQTWSRVGSAQWSNSPTPYALMQPGYYNEPTSWTGGAAPGGAKPHENRPPYLALLFCQKS